jgi:hypothetical protein
MLGTSFRNKQSITLIEITEMEGGGLAISAKIG